VLQSCRVALGRLDVMRLVRVEIAHVVVSALGHSLPLCRAVGPSVSNRDRTRTHTHARG
jgi:hypothetical protein